MLNELGHSVKHIKVIRKKKDPRIAKEYKKILKYKKMIKFVYQNQPLGTGDAVLKTKKLIKSNYFLFFASALLVWRTPSVYPFVVFLPKKTKSRAAWNSILESKFLDIGI